MRSFRCIRSGGVPYWANVGDYAYLVVDNSGYKFWDNTNSKWHSSGHNLNGNLVGNQACAGYFVSLEGYPDYWIEVRVEKKAPPFKVGDVVEIITQHHSDLEWGSVNYGKFSKTGWSVGTKGKVEHVDSNGALDLRNSDPMAWACSQTHIHPETVKLVTTPTTTKASMSTSEKLEGIKLMEQVKEKSIDELLKEAEKVDPPKKPWQDYAKPYILEIPSPRFGEITSVEVKPDPKPQIKKNPRAYWEEELDELEEEIEEEDDDLWSDEEEEEEIEEEMHTDIDDLIKQAENAEKKRKPKEQLAPVKVKVVKKVKNEYEVSLDTEEKPFGFTKDVNKVTPSFSPRKARGLGFRTKRIL